MNIFLKMAFLFFIGSLLGWGIEVVYRRFFSKENKEKKWINPGFLVGPYLPLYGFGLCTLYLLARIDRFLPMGLWWGKLLLFVGMAVCMTALEFVAGLIFIRHMKVKLWDYTNEKGNIMGIICPKFSLFWALLGAVYYFLVHPHILGALHWLAQNLAFSFVLGFFYGVLTIDLVYSFRLVAKVRAFAKENELIVRYEALRQYVRERREEQKKRVHFLLSLRSEVPLPELLREYAEHLKNIRK